MNEREAELMNDREAELIRRAFMMYYHTIENMIWQDDDSLGQNTANEFFEMAMKLSTIIGKDVTDFDIHWPDRYAYDE